MILISLLIYIIGFFVTHWAVGPTHDGIKDDPAQRAIALLWVITLPIFIVSILVSIVRQMGVVKNNLTTETKER
jgi:peptidoglycan biosynthesis protein MviN/MurJ (putative lipid II flippase)